MTRENDGGTRRCQTCGKPLTRTPYELWLFSRCRACTADATPVRYSAGTIEDGTYRKWRYQPQWHRSQANEKHGHTESREDDE
jgi:hypothetical protein